MLYLIKQVELAIRDRLDDLFRPVGLTALQYTALTTLEQYPDLTSAQLARQSFVTAQTMADMVVALEKRGLIQRQRDESDRRRLVLSLSAEGRALLRKFRKRVSGVEEQMLTEMSERQVSTFRKTLQSCLVSLAAGE
jgi:DNA-binding MarR family transcriptional regulator